MNIQIQPLHQSMARFGAASTDQAAKLLATLQNTASNIQVLQLKQRSTVLSVEFNGKPYTVEVDLQNTFKAVSNDGNIVIKMEHDKSTWGSPKTFSYTNHTNPSQSIKALRDPQTIGAAEKLAQQLLNASDSDLDI